MKIDWVRKLTSRKFWTAIASFASMLAVAFGGADSQATQITALIMAGASVVAYIIGEGLTDAASVEKVSAEAIPLEAIEALVGEVNELESK